MRLRPADIYAFDVYAFWRSKLATALRPLALQAIRVLTLPRSGAVIEGAFSIVQLLQSNRRVNVGAEQTQTECLIRLNPHILE